MTDKLHRLARRALSGALPRREFLRAVARAGGSLGAAAWWLGHAGAEAWAQGGPDFRRYRGRAIRLLLARHPYVDALLRQMDGFKALTGIDVSYEIYPIDICFAKADSALTARSPQYDAIVTAVPHTWKYAWSKRIVDLGPYLANAELTAETYAWNDVLEPLRRGAMWDGVPGSEPGTQGARLWSLPLGFELAGVTYNRRVFDAMHFDPPKHLPDLVEKAVRIARSRQMSGIAVRGAPAWPTLLPGFISAYASYGAMDFERRAGRLHAAMNGHRSYAMHALWVEMVRHGAPRRWSQLAWYDVGNEVGAGNCAMMFDADALGLLINSGHQQESGNLGFHALAPAPGANGPTACAWIWSLMMNAASRNKEAAWYWMQWATSPQTAMGGALHADLVDPVRATVWDNAEFQERLNRNEGSYLPQFRSAIAGARIGFTPNPLFAECANEWAAALQSMCRRRSPIDETLDELAATLDRRLRAAGV